MQETIIELGNIPDKLEYNRGIISFATVVTQTYEDAGVTITMSKKKLRIPEEPEPRLKKKSMFDRLKFWHN